MALTKLSKIGEKEMVEPIIVLDEVKVIVETVLSAFEDGVADALELIGGKVRKQIPITQIADRATIWIIRNHDEYLNMPSADLGKKYVPFYTDKKKGGK